MRDAGFNSIDLCSRSQRPPLSVDLKLLAADRSVNLRGTSVSKCSPNTPFAELPVEVNINESGGTVETVNNESFTTGSSIGEDHGHHTFIDAMERDFDETQPDEMLVDNHLSTSNRGDNPVQTRGGIKQSSVPPLAGVVGRDYASNMPVSSCVNLYLG